MVVEALKPKRGGFLRPFGCGWFITTDFDFTNAAPFEFALETPNSRRRSGYG